MSPGSLPILRPGNFPTITKAMPATTITAPQTIKYLPIIPRPSGIADFGFWILDGWIGLICLVKE
jgi:hypothetical protein